MTASTSWIKLASRRLRSPINRYRAMRRLREYHSQARDIGDVVSWAFNFGGSGFYRVKMLQIETEIHALATAVAAVRPRIILEIGTAAGGTLLIWSKIASRRVISCDLREMKAQAALFQRFPPPGSHCQVTLLTGNSHSREFREKVEKSLRGEDVDFLFIDGDHTEEGVRADFLDYRHLVRPGGIIAFHDIAESQPVASNQVYRLWKTLRDVYETEEFVSDKNQTGYGVGIVRVGERFPRIA